MDIIGHDGVFSEPWFQISGQRRCSYETTWNPMPFNDVEEGFIPSLRTVSIALKLLSGCLMLPGGDKPRPYVNCNVIDYF